MRKKKSKKLHPTGQLSIFIILVFQALFVLFAMSLNVALVVHDKINLQNSVDVAAYYGAMKQAEMMNTIAHINYQIRQSWKLLVWRYRVLGSMGVTGLTPSPFISDTDSDHSFRVFNYLSPGPYFFCVGHKWWGGFEGIVDAIGSTADDNLCTDMGTDISNIDIPSIGGTLGGFGAMLSAVGNLAGTINSRVTKMCNRYAFNSWLLGIMSFVHFRRDQSNRKHMIKRLAEELSYGKELSGGFIKEGVEKTFKNNLSYINKQNYQSPDSKLEQFSSLEGRPPGGWLADKPFYDLGLYANLDGSNIRGCSKQLSLIHHPPASAANTSTLLAEIDLDRFGNWPDCNSPHACNPSAGLSKQENFLVFYSVRAEINYKNQIFLPGSRNITLKAKAYAKPFGGIIGPPPGTDERLPDDVPPSARDPTLFDALDAPNYSRYPGDPLGLRSRSVHHYWINKKLIKTTNEYEKKVSYYLKQAYRSPPDNDPLAKNTIPGSSYGMGIPAREWEVEAISPDLFDVTYFTILPHYTHSHFPKVQKLLGPQPYLRGDLGMTRTGLNDFEGKTILSQVNASSPSGPFYVIKNQGSSSAKGPSLLLTGWNPPKQKYKDNNYDPDRNPSNFGKCFHWASLSNPDNPLGKIANGCIYGGRAGYSVKLVSDDFLKELETHGGFSASNPKPSWWNE